MHTDRTDEQVSCEMNPSRKDRRTPQERMKKQRTMGVILFVVALLLIAAFIGCFHLVGGRTKEDNSVNADQVMEVIPPSPSYVLKTPVVEVTPVVEPEETPFLHETEQTIILDDDFPSKYALLIDAESGEILAEKNSYTLMNPASMTKVLTLLVAAENISDTSGTFTMTREISEYCFVNECSVVGYIVGETVPIEELFYGCILCSGADASLALAELAAGSHEKFVELMNDKIKELGLSETANFTNCVGLFDEQHKCTTADMALIMKAALENEKCKEIICTKLYYSVPTEQHPEGQVLSNWFVRSLEDENNGIVKVLGGKRGYVPQSGCCAVSYGETESGQSFICVTGRSYSQKQAIYDHAALYKKYCH